MGKQWTAASYKRRLLEKFGQPVRIAKFKSIYTPLKHECTECKSPFIARPAALLYEKTHATCIRCSRKRTANGQKETPKVFLKKLRKKFNYIECVDYVANHSMSKFKCTCGHEWETKPYELLKLKHGCPDCASVMQGQASKLSDLEIVEKLKANNSTIKFIKSVKSGQPNRRATFKCSCGHVWDTTMSGIIHGRSGCPKCYLERTTEILPSDRLFTLGDREVVVQGYEDVALSHLLQKFKPSQIKVATEGIKVVTYILNGVYRSYYPDIQIGKTLIEVKSTYTLFADWKKNMAKAKACIKQGFKFRMLVPIEVKRDLFEVVELPQVWTSWSEEQADSFIQAELVDELRVICFDPGVENFAWSVLNITKPFKVEVIATGMMQRPMRKLTGNVMDEAEPFIAEIRELLDNYKPNRAIAERFMSRGLKGTTIELVNIMIGIIYANLKGEASRKFTVIPAAQWKNAWNRVIDLEGFYAKVSCAVHQADSIGIGLYGAYKWLNQTPYHNLTQLCKSLPRQISIANVEVTAKKR